MRQTDVRRASSLNAPTLGAGHNKSSGKLPEKAFGRFTMKLSESRPDKR